ncbi:MAG: hypothetical protein ACREV7_21005 [Steroidobacteraceae bacterium]
MKIEVNSSTVPRVSPARCTRLGSNTVTLHTLREQPAAIESVGLQIHFVEGL